MSLSKIRHLMLFEFKQSKWMILLLVTSLIGLTSLSILSSYLLTADQLIDHTPMIYTAIFLLTVLIITVRPKIFRTQNISYNFRACEHLVHLQQLPLSQSTIILYRLMTNFIMLIPLLMLYLVSVYIVIDPLRELLPIGNFLVFSVIWLTIGMIILNIQVIVDFGVNILFSYIYLIFFIFPIIIGGFILFHIISNKNLFELTIHICKNYPLITTMLSIFLIVLSTLISYRWSLRRLHKLDYLL